MAKSNKKGYTKADRDRERRKKDLKTYILGVIIGAIILAGVIGYYKVRALINDTVNSFTGDPATVEQDIVNAPALTIEGSYKNSDMTAVISTEEGNIGGIKEEGMLSPTVWIHCEMVNVFGFTEFGEAAEKFDTRTFVFLDADSNETGYAIWNSENSVFEICDSGRNPIGFVLDEKGERISDGNGNIVGESDYFPSERSSDYYTIKVTFTDNNIPAAAKCLMLYLNYCRGLSYHETGILN